MIISISMAIASLYYIKKNTTHASLWKNYGNLTANTDAWAQSLNNPRTSYGGSDYYT